MIEEVDEQCAVVLLPPVSLIDVKQTRRRAFIPYRDSVNGLSGELSPFTPSFSSLSVNTRAELTPSISNSQSPTELSAVLVLSLTQLG